MQVIKDKTFRVVTKRRRRDNNMKWSHTKVFPMKITTFAITFCLLVGRGVCLFCFHCSVMDSSKACPSLSSEPVAWSKNSGKLYDIGTTSTLNCALAYGVQSGQVYYQSGVPSKVCTSSSFQDTITSKSSSASSNGEEVKMDCCTNDGCNWNHTTASGDLTYSEYTGGASLPSSTNVASASIGSSWIPWFIIGLVVAGLLFCLFCFCCIKWTSKKNDDDGDGRQPYDTGYNLANDTFAKLDRFSRKSSRGHGNLENRGNGSARSISVLPAPKTPTRAENIFSTRDHERYSAIEKRTRPGGGNKKAASNFNSAHTDSTGFDDDDIYNAYNKHQIEDVAKRNYGGGGDFRGQPNRAQVEKKREKKLPPGEKPDWQQVWLKEAGPAPKYDEPDIGNAFSFRDDRRS